MNPVTASSLPARKMLKESNSALYQEKNCAVAVVLEKGAGSRKIIFCKEYRFLRQTKQQIDVVQPSQIQINQLICNQKIPFKFFSHYAFCILANYHQALFHWRILPESKILPTKLFCAFSHWRFDIQPVSVRSDLVDFLRQGTSALWLFLLGRQPSA